MNDLDICKRIAEIDGVEVLGFRGEIVLADDYNEVVNLVKSGRYHPEQVAKLISEYSYNPLTDDALWQQLIFKHEVSISFVSCNLLMVRDGVFEKNFTDIQSLKRNALLLIAEAHKDNNNE